MNNENILKQFYKTLNKVNNVRNSKNIFNDLYLPHSDVYYVQKAIEQRSKSSIPLHEIETRMRQLGWIPKEI
jgi:hypothetical protein